MPLPQGLCCVLTCDRGISGFGAIDYVISEDNVTQRRKPYNQTKSSIFCHGPECFRESDGVKHIFLTRCTEKYFPLPDEIIKVERKRAKGLVDAGP